MALFKGTQRQYYDNSQKFTGDGATVDFILTLSPTPSVKAELEVYVDGSEQVSSSYTYDGGTGTVTFLSAPSEGAIVIVKQILTNEQLGNYQYVSIDNIVNNFRVAYVGEGKVISKVKIPDINFHAQRAIAELSYDTLRSEKSQEIEIPPTLKMKLPHDYVNYVQLSWKDNSGIERIIYPARKTSNPTAIMQDADYDYLYDNDDTLLKASDSETWTDFKSATSDNGVLNASTEVDADMSLSEGARYGATPEHTQSNGVFYIDNVRGFAFFSSGLISKVVTIKYISDSLGTEEEMRVHKFAEEAVYKYIAHAILATKMGTPEYVINRFKKEKRAATRQAKLRLSNLKIEEINLVMKNKSKVTKH